MNITFKGVTQEWIQECFLEVLKAYPSLEDCPILLHQSPLKGSTMQAQPIITPKNLFSRKKRYRVRLAEKVRDSDQLRVAALDQEVLAGWFAHELGHLVDFQQHSNLGMVGYGLRYVLSGKFRRKAEHEADYIALRAGFRDEILATKRFLLEHELIDAGYKAKLRRYYLDPEGVDVWLAQQRTHVKPVVELASEESQ